VIKHEKLVEQAAKRGAELRLALTRMVPGYELLKKCAARIDDWRRVRSAKCCG
jgi:hypothetical protein